MDKKYDPIWRDGFLTTVLFIVLKAMGLVTWSWWFMLVTFFAAPVAWICGFVWIITLIVG